MAFKETVFALFFCLTVCAAQREKNDKKFKKEKEEKTKIIKGSWARGEGEEGGNLVTLMLLGAHMGYRDVPLIV